MRLMRMGRITGEVIVSSPKCVVVVVVVVSEESRDVSPEEPVFVSGVFVVHTALSQPTSHPPVHCGGGGGGKCSEDWL
ncbi:hypothetical protein Pmani_037119 [Petrolisthes manimaculis]|uniref:Uncharacterized protein n=1 Tax=Petrolisthes manimaculis TaxID=1843537 RepID=A0AAE1NGZ1_9EUCA|nr:hypothetical protein Pmani_037119 [Petrolisthes manimaculis]